MPRQYFEQIDTWVFDLDNTLYPPEIRLFDQIERRMTAFVSDMLGITEAEANRLRDQYWRDHGTTLAGLMREHAMDPAEFMHDVHDIDFSALPPAPELASAIANLPGRRIVYTNGSEPYARQVLRARGLENAFHAVYGVEHAGYLPKPDRKAFDRVFALDGLDPAKGAMFEDEARNLAAPHAMGMRTVHVAPEPRMADHIHHHTNALEQFLTSIGPAPAGNPA